MENTLLLREKDEILNGDFRPHQKFSYKKALLKKQKTISQKIDYKSMSTFELFDLKKYNEDVSEAIKNRPFYEIIAYFQSIPQLKDKLYYWSPRREINDPLSLLTSIYSEETLLEKLKGAKCKSLIFYTKGFRNFESMLEQRMNIGDLKVLERDLFFFQKYWTTKKGRLSLFNDYLSKNNIIVKHTRKTIDVEHRIITHPFWCDDYCPSNWSFVRLPTSKNLEFSLISCFSFLEIEINKKMLTVTFAQFKGLVEKEKKHEPFWNSLGISYEENIELY